MEPFYASYEVVHDPESFRRLNGAGIRSFWKAWLKYGFQMGLLLALMGLISWIFVSFYAGSYSGTGLAVVCLFFLGVGLLIPVVLYIRAVDNRERDPNQGEVWQCEMDEGGWSMTARDGVRTSIPWKLMKLKFEHPDGWLIQYGVREMWIYRKPLRDHGLEEEFRKRMTIE